MKGVRTAETTTTSSGELMRRRALPRLGRALVMEEVILLIGMDELEKCKG